MFFRTKKAGPRTYLQIVENHRSGGKMQRVIATLGRLEELQSSGQLDALLCSGARFAEAVMLLGAHQSGQLPVVSTHRRGPYRRALVAGDGLPGRLSVTRASL
jgi:hypothetical protein